MNLLPITEKDNLKKGLRLRFLILISFIVSGAFLAGIVMLAPAYLIGLGNFSRLNFENNSPRVEASDSDTQFLNLPAEIDAKSKFLQNYNSSVKVMDSFTEIVKFLPEEVKLDSINFIRGQSLDNKKGASIIISGIASNREMLISFSNSLKNSDTFSDVEVPVSSLTKDKDLPFTMNIFIE